MGRDRLAKVQRDYKVSYAKPSRHTRFQKGYSAKAPTHDKRVRSTPISDVRILLSIRARIHYNSHAN
jgi:hypothetical protein